MFRAWGLPLLPILLAAMVTAPGCGTRKDVDRIGSRALLAGTVETREGSLDRVYVLLHEVTGNGPVVRGIDALSTTAPAFAFVVDPGTPYSLIAFQDSNADDAWSQDEPTAILGDPVAVSLAAGDRRTNERLSLRATRELPPGYAPDLLRVPEEAHAVLEFRIGEVRALDHPDFEPDVGSGGMWRPLETLERRGTGIYFLEPYDPSRIPVLFVHGMGGTPRDFEALLEGLDRKRFQAWVFAYPSGFRLDRIAGALKALLRETRKTYPFDDLFIVAHSMGGLISRAYLHSALDAGEADAVRLFVTFASPWEGHPSAATGIKWMPNSAVPSWFDMTPGSEFLDAIKRPLERDGVRIPHYVFFGYDRTRSLLFPTSSDGTVPMSSQLPEWIQDQADGYWGYDDDHVTILTDEASLRRFHRLLEEQANALRRMP